MIAVTTDRPWVAVPPAQSISDHTTTHDLFLPGVTVAVVESYVIPLGPGVRGLKVGHRLTGFAEVAEVLPILPDPHLADWPEGVELAMSPDKRGQGVEWWWDGDRGKFAHLDKLNLPHAEPGGLALWLTPLVGHPDCADGRGECHDCWPGGCDLYQLIGQTVTITDLVGEIGRWER